MDATQKTPLTTYNYFELFALHPLAKELSTQDKVIAFAVTFFSTVLTSGLFLIGLMLCEPLWHCNTDDIDVVVDAIETIASDVIYHHPDSTH
ncbi:MAG: hypothetical protein HY860_04375 [Chlamydiales bacterium]|nr:hypothetical protein [Chlamydiales bacterium]